KSLSELEAIQQAQMARVLTEAYLQGGLLALVARAFCAALAVRWPPFLPGKSHSPERPERYPARTRLAVAFRGTSRYLPPLPRRTPRGRNAPG
ncbi:hypothetical protein, partial [Desulfofundulus luciae]|uniref:hypothetical protein n=1 Tax=Desulfofundulus luciae TaxID=74702 RepID=UPI0027D79166